MFDAIGFKAKKPIESLPGTSNDKDTSVTTIDHVNPNVGATPFGYRQEDINLLNRGLERKNEIGALLPIQASFNAVIPKVPYYSPERALASNKEDMAQAIAGIKFYLSILNSPQLRILDFQHQAKIHGLDKLLYGAQPAEQNQAKLAYR